MLERFRHPDLRQRHSLERVARQNDQRVALEPDEHDLAAGGTAVEAHCSPGPAHSPMSSPNASAAASPAARPGAALVVPASATSGSLASTTMHATR